MQAFQQLLSPIGNIFHYLFYQPVYNILMVLYAAFHTFLPGGAFALAIIVLTLMLRACLIPLTRKQLKSSRAMQELQPKLKELQARYKNNPQELMAAQQALYKEHGVNPVSGCLPLVVQLPFIYALYGAFENVIFAHGSLSKINGDLYPFVPHLAHLPETGFLWANLAAPDPTHILPILAAIFTFLQLRMAMPVRKPAPASQKDSMTQATGMMQYVMPVMTLVIGLNFAAGLCLYWCISTLFSAVQQYFLTGVGSLFVGIPGLEHLVPEPKEITPPATTARSAAIGAPRSARALTAPTSTPAAESGPGGLRGMLRQMKEQITAAQQVALEKAKPSDSASSDSQNAAKTATGSVVDADESPTVAPRSEAAPRQNPRPRPKTGPVLVKPPTPTGAAQNAAKAPTDSGNVADTVDASAAESAPTPDVSSANGVSNGTSASSKNGNNGSSTGTVYKTTSASGNNGNVPAASGARAGAGTSASGGRPSSNAAGNRSGSQRKPTSNTGNKGSQSARPRSGRPKGGR